MGAQLIIVNKPGAQALVGMNYLQEQPADGHTLLMGGFNFFISNYLTGRTKYRYPDFQPILRAQYDIMMVQALVGGKYRTFDDLIADGKSRPGQLVVGTVGDTLSMLALAAQVLFEKQGVEIKIVPYNRAGKMHAALLGGHLDAMLEEAGPIGELIEAKKIRPLVIFAKERIEAFPDVPTTTDVGAEEVVQGAYRGIAVKAGTPGPIVDYLHGVFKKAMETKLYKTYERSQYMHLRPGYLGPDDSLKFLAEEEAFYTREYKRLGVYKIMN